MDTRKINISFAKSGSGSRTARAILPIKWIDKLEITPENKDVLITLYENSIIIHKEQITEKNINDVFYLICKKIRTILKKNKFITLSKIYTIIEFNLLQYNQDKNKLEFIYDKIINTLEKNNYSFKQINGLNGYSIKETSKTNVEKNSN